MSRGRGLRPGPGSLRGLRWLARVGPASWEPWAVAMGWSRPVAYLHALRLADAGWVARASMATGSGSLLYVTAAGVRVADVGAVAVPAAPAPTSWAHWEASAWTAAWSTVRGRELLGAREILADDSWLGELEWLERDGLRRRGHRPDLVGRLPSGAWMPIEVELTTKTIARLRSVLPLHAGWVAAGRSAAVMYVCGTQALAERVITQAEVVGLSAESPRRTLRVELLDTIHAQARAARNHPDKDQHTNTV